MGQSSRLWGFVSLSGMSAAQHLGQHSSAVSLPRSLDMAIAHTVHSCRNAHQMSLLVPAGGNTSHSWLCLSLGWVLPWAPSCRAVSMAHLYSFPFLPPRFVPTYPPFPSFNEWIFSGLPVHSAGNSLLNYSCSNCWNFKQRDQADFSRYYFSDITMLWTFTCSFCVGVCFQFSWCVCVCVCVCVYN